MLNKPLPDMLRQKSGFLLIAAMALTGSCTAWAAQPAPIAHDAKHPTTNAATTNISAAGDLTPPSYPAGAAARGVRGRVMLKLLVGANGCVRTVQVESSRPAGVFDKVAVAAASGWKFHPRTAQGVADPGWVRVPVDFAPDRNRRPATAG